VIVSGDKDLLAVGEYEGILVLTPRAFLDEFSRPAEA
jgi:predicted nucleic acid-binding protein